MLIFVGLGAAQEFHPDIPKAWDDQEVAGLETPFAQRDRSPRYISAEEYYKLKPRSIYRSYPAYAAGREPAGYREWLKQREPEIIFDPSKLRTKADWIAAGKNRFRSRRHVHPGARSGQAVPAFSQTIQRRRASSFSARRPLLHPKKGSD